MMKRLPKAIFSILISLFSSSAFGQDITFEDFVGTWHGTYSDSWVSNAPMTMTIFEDGFYTETSGHMMPSIYPNTQQCEYQASTNRFHWWYLATVYAGQRFYDHFYYEVVYFQNDTLELHYNFWDDPEPHPETSTIRLVKASNTPPPASLDIDFVNDEVMLVWETPEGEGVQLAELEGYNVYKSHESSDYELVAYTEETSFLIENGSTAGLNTYYITAVYDAGESLPSDEILIIFDTPEPGTLEGEAVAVTDINLKWSEPSPESGPMASLEGYNVYHKFEDGSFEIVAFTESLTYSHESLNSGSHHYYVTAVFDGGESDPSNEVEIMLGSTSVGEINSSSISIYPNPAKDRIFINTNEAIRKISIFNSLGQVLKAVETPSNRQSIDLSDFDSGLYIISIQTNQGFISRKFLVR
ncbi:MAG: T9SS type A sorting domain-containing protein [Bacteroides sp.]|nr:T9SS type A sorting domain-containing protein [Bacteroides sp.]